MSASARYLLDTDVISETRKLRANPGVMAFLTTTEGSNLFVSVLTLGELRKGVQGKRERDPEVADQLSKWVDEIETTFADRILAVDGAVAKRWGELSAARSLPVVETLIAATALEHDLTLVTRNVRDVEATNVGALNPWQA